MSIKLQVGDRVRVIDGDMDFSLVNGAEHVVLKVSNCNTVKVWEGPHWFNMSRFELLPFVAPTSIEEKIQSKIDTKIEELRQIKASFRQAQRELSKLQELQTTINTL